VAFSHKKKPICEQQMSASFSFPAGKATILVAVLQSKIGHGLGLISEQENQPLLTWPFRGF